MTGSPGRFDADSVRESWDRAAATFDRAQASGLGAAVTTTAMHATLEDWFGWLHTAGFQLRAFREPSPTDEALRKTPDLEDSARVPYYVFFDLVKPG